jgi:hypothetical protein
MSPTILIPGITAVNLRPTRSGAGGAFLSCLVNPRRLRRCTPTRSAAAMRAATRLGETAMPCTATSSACTRGEP